MADGKSEILQGTLDLMVLKTLEAMGPLHGYGVARRIEQISEDALQINQGTIYASLVRLTQKGWISARLGHVRQQPQGQVLFHHPGRAEAAPGGGAELGADLRRGRPRAARRRAGMSRCSPGMSSARFPDAHAGFRPAARIETSLTSSGPSRNAHRGQPRGAAWRRRKPRAPLACGSEDSPSSRRPTASSADCPRSRRSCRTCATPSACYAGIPASPPSPCSRSPSASARTRPSSASSTPCC